MTSSAPPLTKKQKNILQKIKQFHDSEGYYPSTRELNQLLHLKSSNTVFSHLSALIKKGFLKKNSKGKIISLPNQEEESPKQENSIILDNPSPPQYSIPFFPETVPAGFQAPAEDTRREIITVDQYLIKHPNNTFAITVKGNSMEKAGILTGDLVLVEKRTDAKPGQIILAHLPSGFTIKRLVQDKQQLYLKAESTEEYQIKLEEGTEIWGVVIGIVRKY